MESGFTGLQISLARARDLKKTYTGGEEGDGLVDSPQWGDIDSLSSDSSLGTDSGGVLTGSGVDDSVDWKLALSRGTTEVCETHQGPGRGSAR